MDFKIVDENGKIIDCEILYTFKNPDSNIDYVLYTDGTMGEDGKLDVYASRYDFVDNSYVLKAIEDDSEWDLIDEVLETFLEE